MTNLKLSPLRCAAYAESRPVKGGTRIVLDAIARQVNWRGDEGLGKVQMSLRKLSQKTRMHVRTVQTHLRRLIEAEEITCTPIVASDGAQVANLWGIPGILEFAKMGPKPKRKQEEKPPPGGGDSDTPYPESQSLKKNPPHPRKRTSRTPEEEGGEGEDRQKLEEIGGEALDTFEREALPKWVKPQSETMKQAAFRIHVARRIQKFGGLELWKDLLRRAKQTKWMQGVDLSLDFFISERSLPKMMAGAYGLPRQQPKTAPLQHDLTEKPWLALLPDLQNLIQQVPYGALQDAVYEAQNQGIFGVHAQAWAVWKIRQA